MTGGAGGLGRAMCASFGAAGNVIVASRSQDKIAAEAAICKAKAIARPPSRWT